MGDHPMKATDMTGQRFGRLTVTCRAGSNAMGRATWQCLCDCGAFVVVLGKDIRTGNTSSCGCLLNERRKVAGRANRRHGFTRTPTYESWCAMRARCEKPSHKSFERYGAKGITVCARWKSFDNFLADMGERPPGKTIDRIEGELGYEPGNCRWATDEEQQRNRSNNRPLEAFGETKLLCEWAEDPRCRVSGDALHKRLGAGWPLEASILTPKYAARMGVHHA